jgi:adenylylsulfate kinase
MENQGTVYFFTGLAGAGKTTIGSLFYRRLKACKPNVVLLDGDQLRRLSQNKHSGYTTEERRSGAFYNFEMANMLAEQGIDVVLCSISMYDDARGWARENIPNYKEIYVKVTWETLIRRDQKGLYSSGTKNVVGVDLPYDEPKHPDIVIENDGQDTPEQIVDQLELVLGIRKNVVLYPEVGHYQAVQGAHVYAG